MTRTLGQIRQDAILHKWIKPRTLLPGNAGPPEPVKKTPYMKLVEFRAGKPIEDLLEELTIDEVAELFDVPRSTVGSWRIRLGMGSERPGRDSFPAGG